MAIARMNWLFKYCNIVVYLLIFQLVLENIALRQQNMLGENAVRQYADTVQQYENIVRQYESRYGPLEAADDSPSSADTGVDLRSIYSYMQALNENLQAMAATNDSVDRVRQQILKIP